MKRIIGLSVLILFSLFSYSQEIQQKNVPAVVLNAFQLKFSNASDTEWRLEKGLYRVNFELNDKDNQVLINYKGVILRHTQDLYVSEIPVSVMKTIKDKVSFFDIGDADLIEEGRNITWYIRMEINDKDHEFIINERGTLLKYEKELRYNEVPAEINNLISTRFGALDLNNAEYEEEKGRGYYHISGEINDMDHKFVFNGKSGLVRHEQDLRNAEVPVEILNSANSSFKGYEIRDADLLDEGGKMTYYLELRRSRETIIVTFNPAGKILEVRKK